MKNIKIEIDVSMYESVEQLKEEETFKNLCDQLARELETKRYHSSSNNILRTTKNAISLLLSRKKQKPLSNLTVYLAMSNLQSLNDTIPSATTTTASNSDNQINAKDKNSISDLDKHRISTDEISFDTFDDYLRAEASFEYLCEYFCHSLSTRSNVMNLTKFQDDVCTHVFSVLNSSLDVRNLTREISRQISYIIQSARKKSKGRSVIDVLRRTKVFVFKFKSFYKDKSNRSFFIQEKSKENLLSKPVLITSHIDQKTTVVQFFPVENKLDITISSDLIEDALNDFHIVKKLDVKMLCHKIMELGSKSSLSLIENELEENLKTEIVNAILEKKKVKFFTVTLKSVIREENSQGADHNKIVDLSDYSDADIDLIIGRTYETRGIKRTYQEDPIPIESKVKKRRQMKQMKQKRDLLHLKDTYNLSDEALGAIIRYVDDKRKLCSLGAIERLRKVTNARFPITATKTSAYVSFSYAVRTAIYIARKYELDLQTVDRLTIRFNMDGTLLGNKHIVAISINCIEGGVECQNAKNLVPLGLFEVQKENTEILRESLPADFVSNIKNLKHISIGRKNIELRVRLGGDLMNAVYVYGLSGFSSNYPCVFCTQHKDDLHVTEDTAYQKQVIEGKGRNKTTATVLIESTSFHDPTKKARSLAEQASCLAKGSNEFGYKSRPLFGDLFDYKDYCIDTLHMKLRVFDVLLKDILARASRTGKYGAEHLSILEKKISILNRHCQKTVGKRVFFQIDTDDRNKTIASHGKLSGHLQDIFFTDEFPYEEILDADVSKSARTVVQKFKEILKEIKRSNKRQKGTLKRLSLEFVKEFRQSGLRTTVTPYIHIIGNHLYEFDELLDLSDYNMQGVEKNNDLLSRLYFSSTNPAKNPLLTMLQKLFRMLEMNFGNIVDTDEMNKFAAVDVFDFDDDDESIVQNESISVQNEKIRQNNRTSRHSIDSSITEIEDETEIDEVFTWSPEKRVNLTPKRSNDRFQSFRRS